MIFRILLCVATVLAGATPGRAQAVPSATSGITVVGRGVVRVRADELRFTASLFANAPRTPGSAIAPADVDGAAEAIAKALRDSGVSDAAVGFAGGFSPSGQGPRTVTGSIHKPTRESVDVLVKRGNAAAAPFANVGLQNIALNFLVDDCTEPEMRAQNAALIDASARALRVARAASLHLGAIVAVNEASAYAPFASSCATRPDTQIVVNGRIDGESATTGDVFVSVTATVTYAIVH